MKVVMTIDEIIATCGRKAWEDFAHMRGISDRAMDYDAEFSKRFVIKEEELQKIGFGLRILRLVK